MLLYTKGKYCLSRLEAYMNIKKTILYLLLSIFILILIYNFVLPIMATGYTGGMGMHMSYYNNSFYYYSNIIGFLLFALIIILVVITLIKIATMAGPKKCNKCGYPIENDDWKICPRCGNPLKDGSVK